MAEIQQTLPPNFQVRLIRDDSEFIRASLARDRGAPRPRRHLRRHHRPRSSSRNFRSTLIAAVAIPTSIIGAFAVMAALGFTLNQMTMLALTLMVGIVIDDAIVVLENIYRFVEEKGMPPFQAAIEGTREIGLAVMATTLSLLAVFVPVGFLGGIVGRFMSSFGLTSAAAIAISLIVSFTLTPMLAARWIKHDSRITEHDTTSRGSGFYRHIDRTLHRRCCSWSMAHRWARRRRRACWWSRRSIPLYKMSGVNFMPDEDESRFQMSVRLPVGSSLAATQSLLDRALARRPRAAAGRVRHAGDRRASAAAAGSAECRARCSCGWCRSASGSSSSRSSSSAARQLAQPYRKSAVIVGPGHQRARVRAAAAARAIQYALVGPDLAEARRVHGEGASRSLDRTRASWTSTAATCPGGPNCGIDIDRKRAADLGIRVQDVSQTVNALMAGQDVTTYNAASDQYDVVLKAQDSFRRTPETLPRRRCRTGERRAGAAAEPGDVRRRSGPGLDRPV